MYPAKGKLLKLRIKEKKKKGNIIYSLLNQSEYFQWNHHFTLWAENTAAL